MRAKGVREQGGREGCEPVISEAEGCQGDWGPEGGSYKMQRFRGARALRSCSDEGVENGMELKTNEDVLDFGSGIPSRQTSLIKHQSRLLKLRGDKKKYFIELLWA